MKTIIAEKPSVARDIAKVVGATTRKDGYLEGNNYRVTWAIGHLVGLAMPGAYGYDKWELESLPIIPDYFKLEVTYEAGILKQFKIIKELFSNTDEIIVATDAGREGELIFRYIYELSKPSASVEIKRLWISDLTEVTIRKGLQELKPISQYDNLYLSGKARSEADWLVGINFTQAFTVASKKSKALSIGRVQTATLRLIVDRYLENTTFKSIPFYVPKITLEHNSPNFDMTADQKYEQADQAQMIIENLKGIITPPLEVSNKETSEKPPFLYDLTTLQREANKMHGLTAKQTLDIAQSLYEKHKATTYPRTDSQYLATNQIPGVKEVFNSLSDFNIHNVQLSSLKHSCLENVSNNSVFNDSKVSDHHAIIPTATKVDLNHLSDKEKLVYLMVVTRFYQTFLPPCIKDTRTFKTIIREVTFSASTTIIKSKGWRILLPEIKEVLMLPNIQTGETKKIIDCEVTKGQTKPKALFTENSLLAMMETAGKLVSDKELRDSLKEKGLGTGATRAAIIETLIKRQYIIRENGKLIPTEIAIQLIKAIYDLSVCSPELTGEFEHKLGMIEKGTYKYSTFINEMASYVKDLLPQIIKSGQSISNIQTVEEKKNDQNFGTCPKCKNGIIKKGKKSTYCTNWNSDTKCDFTIWLTIAKKKLTDKQIQDLISLRKTKEVKGFESKAGKSFDAPLKLDESFKVMFDFKN